MVVAGLLFAHIFGDLWNGVSMEFYAHFGILIKRDNEHLWKGVKLIGEVEVGSSFLCDLMDIAPIYAFIADLSSKQGKKL